MDRDRRWERTERAYERSSTARVDMCETHGRRGDGAYAQGETDEFLAPRVVVDEHGEPVGPVVTAMRRLLQLPRGPGAPDHARLRGRGSSRTSTAALATPTSRSPR
jgi:hypothetical protein